MIGIYKYLLSILVLSTVLFSCKTDTQTKNDNEIAVLQQEMLQGNPVIDGLSAKIESEPENTDLLVLRAEAFYELGFLEKAEKDMRRVLQSDSSNIIHVHLLSDIYFDNEKKGEAINLLEKYISNHSNIPSLLKLAEFQYIEELHHASLGSTDKILEINIKNPEAYYVKGMNYNALNQIDSAIQSFSKAISYNAKHTDALANLAIIESKRGNTEAALNFFNQAEKVSPKNIDLLYAKAEFFQEQSQFEKAIEVYEKMNSFQPQETEAFFQKGLALLETKKYLDAYKAFNIAIMNEPEFIEAYYFRGLSAQALGKINAAKADFQQAIQFNPQFEEAQEALELLNQKK